MSLEWNEEIKTLDRDNVHSPGWGLNVDQSGWIKGWNAAIEAAAKLVEDFPDYNSRNDEFAGLVVAGDAATAVRALVKP